MNEYPGTFYTLWARAATGPWRPLISAVTPARCWFEFAFHSSEGVLLQARCSVPGRPWLAAVAVVPIVATVYQTLVLTDVTDDVIRKGIDAEHYSMIWTNVCWEITVLYGVFGGIWAMARFGARDTLLDWARLVRAGKFSTSDLPERAFWGDYMDAYEDALAATTTEEAPWYVVPADNKWVTRAVVADVITTAIRSVDLRYPEVTEEKRKLLIEAKSQLEAE